MPCAASNSARPRETLVARSYPAHRRTRTRCARIVAARPPDRSERHCCLGGKRHGVTAGCVRSDGEHKLGERSRELMSAIDVSAKFVMTATQILDEGVPEADHRGQAAPDGRCDGSP